MSTVPCTRPSLPWALPCTWIAAGPIRAGGCLTIARMTPKPRILNGKDATGMGCALHENLPPSPPA